MRESLRQIIQDPTISDACKLRILIEAVEVQEERIEFLTKTCKDAFAKLTIAGSVMDRQNTERYIAALAAQN